MKIYILQEDYYDYTSILGVYTKEALDRVMNEMLNEYLKDYNSQLEAIKTKYLNEDNEKRLEYIYKSEEILVLEKKAKQNNDMEQYWSLKRERKHLLHEAQKIKNRYERQITLLNTRFGIFPYDKDSDLLPIYLNRNKLSVQEFEITEE